MNVVDISEEEEEEEEMAAPLSIRLKPVSDVFLGKARYSASMVEFTPDRITLTNLTQPGKGGKYNITMPYREMDAFRHCFMRGLSLVVIQPVLSSYQKLAYWTSQPLADVVPENFVMLHGDADRHGGQLSKRQIERIRGWAEAECEESSIRGIPAAVKFLAITINFAETYLSTPNRSLRKVTAPSGPFTVSSSSSTYQNRMAAAKASTAAASKTPELIDLVDDDDEEESDETVSFTSNGAASAGTSAASKDGDPGAGAAGNSRGTPGNSKNTGDNGGRKRSMLNKVVLKYPPEEKNQIVLYGNDLLCLRDGQYLNDNIVNFYLKHYQKNRLSEHLRGKIFIYDALFATHLIMPKRRRVEKNLPRNMLGNAENGGNKYIVYKVESLQDTYHSTLKAWTKNVDIFTKDYLFIPFIRDQHWFLVILCNLWNLLPKEEAEKATTRPRGGGGGAQTPNSTGTPSHSTRSHAVPHASKKKATIIFMDSLNKHNTEDSSPTSNTTALLKYLEFEYREKYNCGQSSQSSGGGGGSCQLTNYEVLQPKVPQQTNYYDCGLFALEYIERFLADPEGVLESLKRNASSLTKWFEPRDLKMKRSKIHQTIVNLMPPADVKKLERELDEHMEVVVCGGESQLPPPSGMADMVVDDDELGMAF